MCVENVNTNDFHRLKISAVITAYNRTNFIQAAVRSVLMQGNGAFDVEIIVVSNCDFSFDGGTYGIRIRKKIMEGSMGELLAEAIELANGDIIAFLDDDDIWKYDKVRRLLYAFSNKEVIFYHSMYSYIDSQGKPLRYLRKVEKNNLDSYKTPLVFNPSTDPGQITEAIERRAEFNLSCAAVRRSLALKYLDKLKLTTGAPDGFFFWTAVISNGYIFLDNLKLTDYRVHQSNNSVPRNHEYKAKVSQRRVRTFEVLITIADTIEADSSLFAVVKKWLQLYRNEDKLIALVFGKGKKKLIAKTVIGLIRTGFKTRNTQKYRAIGFGILSILNLGLAAIVYNYMRH